MKKQQWFSMFILSLTLAGCAQSHNQTSGAIMGTLAGGLVGSAFGSGDGKALAVGVGAVLGAVIGSNVGEKMDQNDRAMAESAANKAAKSPIGQEITWNNSSTGHSGSAKTVQLGRDSQGHECRKIEQQVTVDGKTDVILVDICLINDHWVVAA
jgi:surface antigen